MSVLVLLKVDIYLQLQLISCQIWDDIYSSLLLPLQNELDLFLCELSDDILREVLIFVEKSGSFEDMDKLPDPGDENPSMSAHTILALTDSCKTIEVKCYFYMFFIVSIFR